MKIIKKLGWLIILLATICLPGCWDIKNIETLDIPVAAGYELSEKGGTDDMQLDVYGVFPIFFKNAPAKYVVDRTSGFLVGDTRSKRSDHYGERLSLGSFQVAVLGSKLASYGARDALSILIRTPEMKKTVNLAIAEDDINDIFSVESESYPNVGIYLNILLDGAFRQSFVPESTIHTFMVSMDTPCWHPVAPMLKAQDNQIFISGYGVFEDDKLVHTITVFESRLLNLLRNRSSSGRWSYSFLYQDQIPMMASVKTESTAQIRANRSDNGYRFEVNIHSKGSLIELIPSSNYKTFEFLQDENVLKSEELMNSVKTSYQEYMLNEVSALIQKAQKDFGMDIFNWVKFAQAKWRRELEDVDWDELFSQSEVLVNVTADIQYIGEQT